MKKDEKTLIGIIGFGLIILYFMFKKVSAVVPQIYTTSEFFEEHGRPEDVQRLSYSTPITRTAVTTDVALTGGAITKLGYDFAQSEYEKYQARSPQLGEQYKELSGTQRTLVSLGDAVTLGYASKLGEKTGELINKYRFW